MNLSMWMIAEALKQYPCRLDIVQGKAGIRGARFLAQVDFLESDIVYIGARNEFIDGHASNGVICTHQNDSIIIEGETQLEVFNDLLNLIDLYRSWSEEMEQAVRDEDSLRVLVTRSSRVISSRIWIVERGGRVCCANADSLDPQLFYLGEKDPFVRSSGMHLIDVHSKGHVNRKPFMVPELNLCCQDLYDGNYRVGMLLVETGEMMEQCLLQLVEKLGLWLEKWMGLHVEREDLPWNGNVLRQMLTSTPEPACMRDFSEYLQGLGWEAQDKMLLYLILPKRRNMPLRSIIHLSSMVPGTVVTTYESYIIILVNERLGKENHSTEKIQELAALESWAVGVSYPFANLKELYQGYNQALLALGFAQEAGTVRPCHDCMPEYICQLVRSQTASDLSHPALAILEAYDQENGTQLMETLEMYLLCERGQKQTSAMLSVHRNSVFYRLNQIQALCELNLEDPKTRLQLMLSFLLRSNGRLPTLPSAAGERGRE